LGSQWHYHNTGQAGGTPGCDISLFDAWEIETGNSNVIVSVVDCGINASHPDLGANMWTGIGYNFWQNTSSISPGSHGCHTGGTISAVTNNGVGVAGIAGGSGNGDGVRLMTCQVFNSAGNNGGGFANAYFYAADNGSCISQNSWGYTQPNVYEQDVLTGIDYFHANGGGDVMNEGIVIFSSGNNSSSNLYWPGAYSPVLAVASTTNTDTKSYFSNYGTWVQISAPGGSTNSGYDPKDVLSCNVNGYQLMAGTSMACPHVSGVAALLVSYAARLNFVLSRQDIWNLLMDNVDNHYNVNPSYTGLLGTGRLNAYKALLALTEMVVIVEQPVEVAANALSFSDIEINWTKNADNDKVVLLCNTINEFGVPERGTEYKVGDILANGGKVVYFGEEELFLHSELSEFTTYYYKLFSYNEEFLYSKGIECEATTLCKVISCPLFEGFEDGIEPCWLQESSVGSTPWILGKGNDFMNPDIAFEGENNIYFRGNSFKENGNVTRLITPYFEMNGFTHIRLSLALYNEANHENVDELSIFYRTNNDPIWVLLKTYSDNQDSWLLDTLVFPEFNETDTYQICFQGKLNGGYGICVDNILVEGFNTVGMKDGKLDSKITIYPNPATEELRVMSLELRVDEIAIFDIYGKQILLTNHHHRLLSEVESPHTTIDISHLNIGVYFISITTELGVVNKKFVKM
jgi:hypothetical protein